MITGARGFIGSHLLARCRHLPHDYVAVVRRLEEGIVDCEYCMADMSDPDWTDSLPTDVESVIHLAQSKEYRNFPDGASDMVSINVKSTFDLLEWSRKNSVKRLVLASTGNVYEHCPSIIGNDCIPNSMYAASKMCSDMLALQYRDFFSIVVCRLFSVYGPCQENMLIPNLVKRIEKEKPIYLAGGKGIIISPIHVYDVCDGLMNLATSCQEEGVVHFAGPQVLDLKIVAETIGFALGKQPIFENTDGVVRNLAWDGEEALRIVGRSLWRVEEGLKTVVDSM